MSKQDEKIWASLLQAGLACGTAPETGKAESPWFVKVLLGFSGWVAALFLLCFIGVGFEFVFDNSIIAFIIGGLMIGGGFFILRIPRNEFLEQLALAISLAGQALVIFVFFKIADDYEAGTWLLVALLEISLAAVMPNFVHRVLSSFFSAIAFYMALNSVELLYIAGSIVMLLASLCWLNEFRYMQHMKKARAIGYGLVLGVILLKGAELFSYKIGDRMFYENQLGWWGGPWLGNALASMVMLYIVWNLLQRYHQPVFGRCSIAALTGALILCGVSFEIPGITIGMAIMLLGFSGSNRILIGLGIVSLLFFISSYYYLLDATLLAKSQTLLVVGLVLLVIRWMIRRILPVEKEMEHA